MLFATVGQWVSFLVMAVTGMLIGLSYGLTERLRSLIEPGWLLSLAVDLAFGVLAGVLLVMGSMVAGYGQLRLWELLGAGLGAGLYWLTIHRLADWLLGGLGRLLRSAGRRAGGTALVKRILR